MAMCGNKCPGIKEYHTFDSRHCLDVCDHQCLPASVLVHIQQKARVDKHQGEYISVTSLLGCMRQLYLERTTDYYVEPPKNWYSIRGTLLHLILQNPDLEGQIEDMRRYVYRLFAKGQASREDLEQRWIAIEAQLLDFAAKLPRVNHIEDWQSETEYEFDLGVINGKERKLKGTIDVLRPERGQILDYKTIGDRGLGMIKDGAKPDHIMQFNLYRLLVERGHPTGDTHYTPVKVNSIRAFYMSMMTVVGTGGVLEEDTMFQKSEPERHTNEVGREVIGERKDLVLKRGKRKETAKIEDYELSPKSKYRLTYAIPDVPLLDLDSVEAFARANAAVLVEAFDNGTMPPWCDAKMRAWKCERYCPVKDACDDYQRSLGQPLSTEGLEKGADFVPVESV